MRPHRLARYEAMLSDLAAEGRRRSLNPAQGADFTSNDYLGLAGSGALDDAVARALARGVPVGAGGSRLLRGNHPEHEALEAEAAAFFGAERMLYFGGGYPANLALLATLPQRGDLVVHDELIHASAHAGMTRGRADIASARHNDVDAFADAIGAWRERGGRGHPWIAVESLYSMDGDRAPLDDLMALADRHDGFLLVDEAHATGVHGPDGRGLAAHLEGRDNVVVLHTCGKALGAAGALVGASRVLCDFLVNRASAFIFATAPSPLVAAAVRQAIAIVRTEPARRQRLQALVDHANALVRDRLGHPASGSQILPVLIRDNARTAAIAQQMRAGGFDIRAIRPPTVPPGTARLRLAVTLNVDTDTVSRMVDRLADVLALPLEKVA